MLTDTIARKVNSSDASRFAVMIGFFGPRVWGEFPANGTLTIARIDGFRDTTYRFYLAAQFDYL
jgi:hypothetical protein